MFIQPCSKLNNTFVASIPKASPITVPICLTAPTIRRIGARIPISKALFRASTVTAVIFITSLITIPNSDPSVVRFVNAAPNLCSCPCIVFCASNAALAAVP